MFLLRSSLTRLLVIGTCFAAFRSGTAQIVGEFVIPEIRSDGESDFVYWDLFVSAPEGGNYLYENPPALYGGIDAAGNGTSLTEDVYLMQTTAPNAFVTSSGAIYDFGETTAFRVGYAEREDADPITNVIFQCMTGGRRLELDEIVLTYLPAGAEEAEVLSPVYKALDDPHTGAFSERLISAFQWDLTGLEIQTFSIQFHSPGSSMPLWESQLDVVHGGEFKQELGYLLMERYLPSVRAGSVGLVYKDIPFGDETRFHLAGEQFDLLGEPEFGFEHTGWIVDGEVIEEERLGVEFGESDQTVTALFAVTSYEDWRDAFFFHENAIIEQGPDNTDDTISGVDADPDGDGMINLKEYAFGGDPYRRDAAIAIPEVEILENDGDRYFTIRYRRQASSDDLNDLIYRVQHSHDLKEWTTFEEGELVLISDELETDSYRTHTYRRLTEVTSESAAYYRVEAQLKP